VGTDTAIKQALFIGIDGGGSKCKATIVDADNNILGSGVAGPANPFHGFEQATDSIVASARLALSDAGLSLSEMPRLIAGIGLAGVNLPSLMSKMKQWQHPFKQLFLTTDLNIACLGAHNGEDGAILITGTGSCGYSNIDGDEFFIGGHGFPHGDKGSGAWTGLEAVSYVLRSLDGLEVDSLMNQQMLDKLQCSNFLELIEVVAKKPANFYASLAYIAFDAAKKNDPLALSIVQDGADYMSAVANKLWANNPQRMSLIGGLTPVIMPYLEPTIAARLSQLKSPPEIGAVIFAKQQLDCSL